MPAGAQQANRNVRPALPRGVRKTASKGGATQQDTNGRLEAMQEGTELEQEAAQALNSRDLRPRSQSVLQPSSR